MKSFLMSLLAAPAAVGLLLSAQQASAQDVSELMEQVGSYAMESDASFINADPSDLDASIDQVTSVSQLRDVRPTDWAFQALQSLVERYGCIAGYPDGTYRGNRAMTRYEFAAGLNACLDRVNELIASATADLVTQEDLAVLQRLQEEFQAELATLRGRVDALEARTAELEANQFSTTTKMKGVAWMDLGTTFDGESGVGVNDDAEDEVTFGTRVRLALNTSFSGKDLLRTRLQFGGKQPYALRFESGAVPALFEAYPGSGNNVILNELWYKFPVGKANVFVGTRGLEPDVIAPTQANLSKGYTFSDFYKFNPVSYKRPFGTGAGAGFNYQLGGSLNVAAAYLANSFDGRDDAGQAGEDNGLTGAANVAFGQLTFTPGNRLTVAGTYSRNYSPDGAFVTGVDRGTLNARRPFAKAGNPAGEPPTAATTTNNYGINASYKISSKLNVSGWAGWSDVEEIDSGDEADIFTWAVLLGFPDLFREGNFGTVAFGAPPYVTNSDAAEDDDTPFMVQAAYGFKVSDNITVKPQVLYLTNPNGSDDNDSAWVGSLLTVFKF